MSHPIWMQCGGRHNLRVHRSRPWRVVEAQHQISTRTWVDSDDEQRLLKELIEGVKPPVPDEAQSLHYLLSTAFRYPPLPHGSRFGGRFEPSLWYGSLKLRTAFAEVAFWRLVFLEGSEARLEPLAVQFSAFRAEVASEYAVDLSLPPFEEWNAQISDPCSYAVSQALGTAMRKDGVEVALYRSARDPMGGLNLALFTPAAFASARPSVPQTWQCFISEERIEFVRRDYFAPKLHAFLRSHFERDGVLPLPVDPRAERATTSP